MAFKLKPPYKIETTPIYRVNDDPNVLGRANNNGTITINKDVEDPKELNKIKKSEAFPFYDKILENICFADYIDRITFQKQIWQFNEMNET